MLKEGKAAPAFSLESDDGSKVSLKDYKGQWVALYFYPKDDTPGCTKEACGFGDALGPLKKLGAAVLGVSRDSVDRHVKFKKKYGFKFPLLADVEGKVCEAYGAWQMKSLYGRKFMGIVRMTFLISPAGKVAKIYPKVKVDGHVDAVVADIKALKSDS